MQDNASRGVAQPQSLILICKDLLTVFETNTYAMRKWGRSGYRKGEGNSLISTRISTVIPNTTAATSGYLTRPFSYN